MCAGFRPPRTHYRSSKNANELLLGCLLGKERRNRLGFVAHAEGAAAGRHHDFLRRKPRGMGDCGVQISRLDRVLFDFGPLGVALAVDKTPFDTRPASTEENTVG